MTENESIKAVTREKLKATENLSNPSLKQTYVREITGSEFGFGQREGRFFHDFTHQDLVLKFKLNE